MHNSDNNTNDLTDLEAPVAWDIEYPSWVADEILPGLFLGGTHDDATVADPMLLAGLGGWREYDAVVTLYAWAQPSPGRSRNCATASAMVRWTVRIWRASCGRPGGRMSAGSPGTGS